MKIQTRRYLSWSFWCLGVLFLLLFVVNLLPASKLSVNLAGVLETQHFTSCEIALSLVVEQKQNLARALSPTTVGAIVEQPPCQMLDDFYQRDSRRAPIELSNSSLRLRYVWGVRAIYGLLALAIPEPYLELLLAGLTLVMIALISVLFFNLNFRAGILSLPMMMGGALFSGIFTQTPTALAINYLWAWGCGLLLFAALKHKVEKQFCLIAGMVSAYLWFMDAHIILSTTLIILTSYMWKLSSKENVPRNALGLALKNATLYHIGFITTIIVFALAKVAVFGLSEVIQSFSGAIIDRASNQTPSGEMITLHNLFIKLLFVGYQETGTYGDPLLWKILLISTLITSLVGGILFLSNRVYQSTSKMLFISVLIIISAYCLARLFTLPNHSYVHAYLVSRYLFIPLACAWSFTLCAYLKPTDPDKDS